MTKFKAFLIGFFSSIPIVILQAFATVYGLHVLKKTLSNSGYIQTPTDVFANFSSNFAGIILVAVALIIFWLKADKIDRKQRLINFTVFSLTTLVSSFAFSYLFAFLYSLYFLPFQLL